MTKEKEVEEAIKNVKAAWNTDTYPAHVWARMATVLATALEAAQQTRAADLLNCPQCQRELHNGYCSHCKAAFESASR